MSFKAFGENVVIKVIKEEFQKVGNIIIENSEKQTTFCGIILDFDSDFVNKKLEINDKVYFKKDRIITILEEKEDGDIVVINYKDIIAKEGKE